MESIFLCITDDIRERTWERGGDPAVEGLLSFLAVLCVAWFVRELWRAAAREFLSGGYRIRKQERDAEEESERLRRVEDARRRTAPTPDEAVLELLERRVTISHIRRRAERVSEAFGSLSRAPAYIRNGLDHQLSGLSSAESRVVWLEQFIHNYERTHGVVAVTPLVLEQIRVLRWSLKYQERHRLGSTTNFADWDADERIRVTTEQLDAVCGYFGVASSD